MLSLVSKEEKSCLLSYIYKICSHQSNVNSMDSYNSVNLGMVT